MALANVVLVTALVVLTGVAATCALCIDARQIGRATETLDRRLADLAPYLGVTAACYLLKKATHGVSLRVSKQLDWNITDEIYAVEGSFVGHLQTVVPDALYPYFSGMYMFGFTYLLVAPVVAYFLLPSQRRLKELLVAYVLNYAVGVTCYTLFIAYGPRNWTDAVREPLFTMYPQSKDLTSAVGANTNVFPSLHASMSVAVALLAWKSRDAYPRWFAIAAFVCASVVLSTMVLGIHWLIDVIAGVALAVWSVDAAARLVGWGEQKRAADPSASGGAPASAED